MIYLSFAAWKEVTLRNLGFVEYAESYTTCGNLWCAGLGVEEGDHDGA